MIGYYGNSAHNNQLNQITALNQESAICQYP